MYDVTCSIPWTLDSNNALICAGVITQSTNAGHTPLPALGTADSNYLIGEMLLLLVLAFVANKLLRQFGWR